MATAIEIAEVIDGLGTIPGVACRLGRVDQRRDLAGICVVAALVNTSLFAAIFAVIAETALAVAEAAIVLHPFEEALQQPALPISTASTVTTSFRSTGRVARCGAGWIFAAITVAARRPQIAALPLIRVSLLAGSSDDRAARLVAAVFLAATGVAAVV
jgi:hypothetical protein